MNLFHPPPPIIKICEWGPWASVKDTLIFSAILQNLDKSGEGGGGAAASLSIPSLSAWSGGLGEGSKVSFDLPDMVH